MFASERGVPQFDAPWVIPTNIAIMICRLKTIDSLVYISAAESVPCIFNHVYVIRPEATKFGEITQPLGLLRRSRSFKVTDFGTNRNCDFLLVINLRSSYIAPFPRYSLGKVQNRYIWLPLFGLPPPPDGGIPLGQSL